MHKNPYPGRFIVFEGLDGCGKSLQAELLTNYLRDKHRDVVFTCEPTKEGSLSLKIEDILQHRASAAPEEIQRLMSEDRREHVDRVILPSLKDGKIVISDRYFFSTFAYGASSVSLERLIAMNEEFISPDATFVLDVDPATCIERIKARRKDGKEVSMELFEKEEKLRAVSAAYHALKDRFPELVFVDGNRAPDEIHEDIVTKLKNILE